MSCHSLDRIHHPPDTYDSVYGAGFEYTFYHSDYKSGRQYIGAADSTIQMSIQPIVSLCPGIIRHQYTAFSQVVLHIHDGRMKTVVHIQSRFLPVDLTEPHIKTVISRIKCFRHSSTRWLKNLICALYNYIFMYWYLKICSLTKRSI